MEKRQPFKMSKPVLRRDRLKLYKNSNTSNRELQHIVLKKLLMQAKNTEFGLKHDFRTILESEDMFYSYKQRIPLTTYDMFYDIWLRRALNREPDVIWPGTTKNYALSSGTTKAGSKYIPVSEQMLRMFKRTSFQQIAELSGTEMAKKLIKTKVLIVGGSTKLRDESGIKVGDLSGILSKNKHWIQTTLSKPGKKISQISDWDEKMEIIVKKAPNWNIGIIAGVPSWITLMFERICKEHQLNNIHEIWPNLQMYVHGGVFLEPYKEKLEKMLGKPLVYQNTYLASEGYFGYQKDFRDEWMDMLLKRGVYYEFVEEKDFDKLRNQQYDDLDTLSIDEVEPNKHYTMIISTCSGLWRYILGDVVTFKEQGGRKFKISGRLSYDLSVCGEHLSEENISRAILETSKYYGIDIQEFCAYPNREKDRHEWYIGVDRYVSISELEVHLDDTLKRINDDYSTARKYVLKPPIVKTLPIAKFYEYMSITNRYGAQNKFPRVMNDIQIKHWESFLSNVDVYARGKDGEDI